MSIKQGSNIIAGKISSGATHFLGEWVLTTTGNDITPEGCIRPDGYEQVNAPNSMFADLWNYALKPSKDWGDKTYLDTCTYEEYYKSIADYGACVKWAVDYTADKFKVPFVPDGYYLKKDKGVANKAGLPNITGDGINSEVVWGESKKESGAIVANRVGSKKDRGVPSGDKCTYAYWSFDASRSNPIYGASDTVETNAVGVRWYIYIANGNLGDFLINWNKLQDTFKVSDGIEIGDIGITPFGINESENKRRYLNGQTISQDMFKTFSSKIKGYSDLYPNLFCTNDEFEEELKTSVNGQCGKFVIDDIAKTIRLPKVVNIQGLINLTQCGMRIDAGLPNITGTFDGRGAAGTGSFRTKKTGQGQGYWGGVDNNGWYSKTFDASKSNPIYGKSTTVQEEAIQYPYFIQVATSSTDKDEIVNTYQLNNPYSLLDCKWSDHELSNVSWLLSKGQWNNETLYPAVYNLLLSDRNKGNKQFYCYGGEHPYYVSELPAKVGDKVYNKDFIDVGTVKGLGLMDDSILVEPYEFHEGINDLAGELLRNEAKDVIAYTKNIFSVKLSTEAFTDYDFVLDIDNKRFRLPIKTKLAGGKLSGEVPVKGNGKVIGLTDGAGEFGTYMYQDNVKALPGVLGQNIGEVKRDTGNTRSEITVGISRNGSKSGMVADLSLAVTSEESLFLYYYVGETVENANLIDAGRFADALANKIDGSGDVDLVVEHKINSDGSWYRKYKSGWVEQGGLATNLIANRLNRYNLSKPMKNTNYYANVSQNSYWSDGNWAVLQTVKRYTTYIEVGNIIEATLQGVWYVAGQGA